MSLYGVTARLFCHETFIDTGSYRLYNDKESPDVVLAIVGGKPIYAHEKVLSAGCKNLRGSRNEYCSARCQMVWNLSNVIHFGPVKVGHESFESAIKHMYGFKFEGIGEFPHSLLDLAEVAFFAEKLEITGLSKRASVIAKYAMLKCVGDEAKRSLLP